MDEELSMTAPARIQKRGVVMAVNKCSSGAAETHGEGYGILNSPYGACGIGARMASALDRFASTFVAGHRLLCPTAFLAIVVVAILPSVGRSTPIWQVTTIAQPRISDASIDLDSLGQPHVAFFSLPPSDPGMWALKHAWRDGSAWAEEVIDNVAYGGTVGLALDSIDQCTIAYYLQSTSDVVYVFRDGSAWRTETVDATGIVGDWLSYALDRFGTAHIAYRDVTNTALKYASKANGIWTIETVDNTGDVGYYTGIAVDSMGTASIVYRGQGLAMARKRAGVWAIEAIASNGSYPAIAVESNGRPHIAYRHDRVGDSVARYATKVGGNWIIASVDSGGDVGTQATIALDSDGGVHMAYRALTAMNLKYAFGIGGQWAVSEVDTAGNVGYEPALQIDHFGEPHVSFGHIVSAPYVLHLKYARGLLECGSAANVIAFSPGAGTELPTAENALGDPDGSAVPLGLEGSVTLAFNETIVDGPGIDMLIYENGLADGAINENFLVEGSSDGSAFTFIGTGAGGTVGFDLGTVGLSDVAHLRISDLLPQEEGTAPPNLGADIDAVQVRFCGGATVRVVDHTGPSNATNDWLQIAPNPMRVMTNVMCRLERDVRVTLRIYDVAGRRVATLLDERGTGRFVATVWNGRNDEGLAVEPGVYLAELQSGDRKESKKIVLVR